MCVRVYVCACVCARAWAGGMVSETTANVVHAIACVGVSVNASVCACTFACECAYVGEYVPMWVSACLCG